MSRLASENDGVKFLLVAVDALSKYAWVRPLPDKTVWVWPRPFTRSIGRNDSAKIGVCHKRKGMREAGRGSQSNKQINV